MSEEPRAVAPMPVLPLNYVQQQAPHRPGIITAMGVVAIVVACLSALASGFWGIGAVGITIGAQVRAVRVTALATASTPATTRINGKITTDDPVDPEEVVEDERQGLRLPARRTIVREMSRHRTLSDRQQHQLHRLLGKYGRDLFPFDGSAIDEKAIANQITDAGPMSALRDASASYFVLGSGKVEVYDDRAIFEPTSRAAIKLRVQDGYEEELQPVVIPAPPAALMMPTYQLRTSGIVLTITESVMSGLLAIYLLVVGILVLRGHRRGRALQRIFAWIKIPLTIAGGVGWAWLLEDSFHTRNSGATSAIAQSVWFLGVVIVGCLYPIILLFVLRARSVTEYYSGILD